MAQQFKNIYFADFPRTSAAAKNLTLAFGPRDERVYEFVRPLSSHEVRKHLGHQSYSNLHAAAESENLPVNSYCLRQLRATYVTERSNPQRTLELDFGPHDAFAVDPIFATFRGGKHEPMHDWYPYLEGYSPGFVTRIIEEFCRTAQTVLDPFAGTGTTPLCAAMMGRAAFFCEVNPLLQYLIDSKTCALALTAAERANLSARLKSIARELDLTIRKGRPDPQLHNAYKCVFGESRFFTKSEYTCVLNARAYIDALACTDGLAARYVTIAALASLIPASLLIRRGDVRYKTVSELARPVLDFVDAMARQIHFIADDLLRLHLIQSIPKLLCEDARSLAVLPSLGVDAVITSPPYLNGTNYFRNSKIELWFLRCLRTPADLAAFRFRAVTAGINDVTNAKSTRQMPPQVQQLVSELKATAYDVRIPRMVADYFTDMATIFRTLRDHLSTSAAVVLDIGDSAYAGIHVPTDRLLASILKDLGYALRHDLVLRTRRSRGGLALRQVLLVFDMARPKHYVARPPQAQRIDAPWLRLWATFKQELPHQRGPYAKRNWGHPLHSLCSYQGKLKPSLAHYLVRTFVPRGGRLLDPFAGVGTIPFEAALMGSPAWAFEISPAALHIAKAKLGRIDAPRCTEVLHSLNNAISRGAVTDAERATAQVIRFNGPLPDYFSNRTFDEILLARRYFIENPPSSASESLVLACLLHILHGNRPYALSRRSHPITPFAPTGPREYRPLMERLRNKVERSVVESIGDQFSPGEALFQDATSWWPQDICDIDAVITSPPFFQSTRFYLANWMRLWFCGWEAKDFQSRPKSFVDERQRVSFDVYEPVLRQARERLRPGGVVVMHLGKSHKCDMAAALARIAAPWFRVVDTFDEGVLHCESHGIRDKGTVTAHQFLILQ